MALALFLLALLEYTPSQPFQEGLLELRSTHLVGLSRDEISKVLRENPEFEHGQLGGRTTATYKRARLHIDFDSGVAVRVVIDK